MCRRQPFQTTSVAALKLPDCPAWARMTESLLHSESFADASSSETRREKREKIMWGKEKKNYVGREKKKCDLFSHLKLDLGVIVGGVGVLT